MLLFSMCMVKFLVVHTGTMASVYMYMQKGFRVIAYDNQFVAECKLKG